MQEPGAVFSYGAALCLLAETWAALLEHDPSCAYKQSWQAFFLSVEAVLADYDPRESALQDPWAWGAWCLVGVAARVTAAVVGGEGHLPRMRAIAGALLHRWDTTNASLMYSAGFGGARGVGRLGDWTRHVDQVLWIRDLLQLPSGDALGLCLKEVGAHPADA